VVDALRTVPAQQRSASRLDELLDTAATMLDADGLESLTTGALAERAGMSIGSVYRYFKDRNAVARALAQRNMDRYVTRFVAEVLPGAANMLDGAHGAIELFADLFRHEPGFRALRFGDVIDEFLLATTSSNNDGLSDAFAQVGVATFGLPDTSETTFHTSVVVELADAILTRAFLANAEGDQRYVDACQELVASYLITHFGDPRLPLS
jgi:AcrR family transcriptional regulator